MNPNKKLPSSMTDPVGPPTPAWWSKLFGGERNKRQRRTTTGSSSFRNRAPRAVQNQDVHKVFGGNGSAHTRSTVSLSSSSSLGDDSEDNDRMLVEFASEMRAIAARAASGGGNNLRRVREHRDLLSEALRLSQEPEPPRTARPAVAAVAAAAPAAPLPAFPHLSLPPAQQPQPQQPHRQSEGTNIAVKPENSREVAPAAAAAASSEVNRRRSRSPALPVARPWDTTSSPTTAHVAGATNGGQGRQGNNKPYRHRYDGDFCCPSCDEAANAHAQEMYARATWQMYDRITRARARAAAAHHRRAPLCVPVPAMVSVPNPPPPQHEVPSPSGAAAESEQDKQQDENEEDEDDDHAVFSLDLDH